MAVSHYFLLFASEVMLLLSLFTTQNLVVAELDSSPYPLHELSVHALVVSSDNNVRDNWHIMALYESWKKYQRPFHPRHFQLPLSVDKRPERTIRHRLSSKNRDAEIAASAEAEEDEEEEEGKLSHVRSFTRILVTDREADELSAFIPTVTVPSITRPPVRGVAAAVKWRPYALHKFFELYGNQLEEQYVLLLDPDMVFLNKLVYNRARPGRPYCTYYHYLDLKKKPNGELQSGYLYALFPELGNRTLVTKYGLLLLTLSY